MRNAFSSSVVSLLAGTGFWFSSNSSDTDLPIIPVNSDDSLLAHWPSEDYLASPETHPECNWWNFSVRYDHTLCSHFAISRQSSTPTRALERAFSCAALGSTECVLSPEVGLAFPAAFLYVHDRGEARMRMVLAPKLLDGTNAEPEQHVRVTVPNADGVTTTKTFLFRKRVHVEYLDGQTRTLASAILDGQASYCVQLLRHAYSDDCWQKID